MSRCVGYYVLLLVAGRLKVVFGKRKKNLAWIIIEVRSWGCIHRHYRVIQISLLCLRHTDILKKMAVLLIL